MKANRITHATLVYQCGLANVFATKRFATINKRERLIQGSFVECEAFARGMEASGVRVESMYCDRAGDILESDGWDSRLENAAFSNSFRPVGKDGGFLDRAENPGAYDELKLRIADGCGSGRINAPALSPKSQAMRSLSDQERIPK